MIPEGTWNPCTDAYAQNEAYMLDYEGNIINNKDRLNITRRGSPRRGTGGINDDL